jgi:hypothetical protein
MTEKSVPSGAAGLGDGLFGLNQTNFAISTPSRETVADGGELAAEVQGLATPVHAKVAALLKAKELSFGMRA